MTMSETRAKTVEEIVEFGFDDGYGDGQENKVRKGLEGAKIIFAEYMSESYEGSCFILFEKGEKLFVVESSHCSCNGLDWSPSEVTLDEALNLAAQAYRVNVETVAEALAAAGVTNG
jgi:hypothetical protein